MSTSPITLITVALLCMLAWATTAYAQDPDEGGCVYDREIYPAGTVLCQAGTKVRCESGAWADIGMCDDDAAAPPPIVGGGDIEE